MTEESRLFYRPAAGIDVVSVGDGALLFRSDTLLVRIEGASVAVLQRRILPLLDGSRSLAEVARAIPTVDQGDLRRQLDGLVQAGVLERTRRLESWPGGRSEPLLALLAAAGLPVAALRDRLARVRIAVLGLEGTGAHAAVLLAACGVGELVLVDPYPCQAGNLPLMPVGADALGMRRDQALKRSLETQGAETRLEIGPSDAVTPDGIHALARNCQLLIGAFDKGLSVAHRWLNNASLTYGIPAIYSQLAAYVARVGPVVAPPRSACYECWRVRSLACADSYPEAAAYQDLLDQQRQPRLHERPVFPALAAYAGSLVAMEAAKLLLSIASGADTLVGRVHEFDALQLRSQTHTLLQFPNCPECRGEDHTQPSFINLFHDNAPSGHIRQAAGSLVSPRCGVITDVGQVPKDPDEPAQPYLYGARLANHHFVADRGPDDGISIGKGLTPAAAQSSALGEAVERYAGSFHGVRQSFHASRQALDAPSLDPADLVLYRPEQYARLPYAPYTDTATLGWVAARSLLSGSEMLVPALAVFIAYPPRAPEEDLCPPTSTGLAAGATLAEAVLAALYEVLERDAFMITWLNRLPAERVDPATHPDPELVDLVHAYARRGVALRLYRLATDHPCQVFLCLALQDGGAGWPAAVAGLGADLDPARAASKAILEAGQVRAGLVVAARDPGERARAGRLVADPRLVDTLDDHALRYIHPGAIGAFAFLERDPEPPAASAPGWSWAAPLPASASDRLRLLAEHLHTSGGEVLYRDLTTADLAPLGLRVARVIVPGFQPLHFGQEPRLGGRRLYELPWRLGLAAAPATPAALNRDPHPLA